MAVFSAGAEEADPSETELFSQEQLAQLVAPIALHPDPLLAQILMASTYPLEVVQAARWVEEHPDLEPDEIEEAVAGEPWDPSVKSLIAFPDVLEMMNEELEWTQLLGDAFLAQQEDVLDAVQQLRARADKAGNLESGDELTVTTEVVGGTVASAAPQVSLSGDPLVAEAQALLGALGYDPGPTDGRLGPRTRAAVAAFELDQGFEATGVVTAKLVGLLHAVVDGLGPERTVYVIEPTHPDIVYVPYYDPYAVYGPWPYPAYAPYYWHPPGYAADNLFWFTAGVIVGAALWGDCDWHWRSVHVDVHHFNRFNRTRITSPVWRHDPVHRGAVPYRGRQVAERFGDRLHVPDAREAFRGRSEAALPGLSRIDAGDLPRASTAAGRLDLESLRPVSRAARALPRDPSPAAAPPSGRSAPVASLPSGPPAVRSGPPPLPSVRTTPPSAPVVRVTPPSAPVVRSTSTQPRAPVVRSGPPQVQAGGRGGGGGGGSAAARGTRAGAPPILLFGTRGTPGRGGGGGGRRR